MWFQKQFFQRREVVSDMEAKWDIMESIVENYTFQSANDSKIKGVKNRHH